MQHHLHHKSAARPATTTTATTHSRVQVVVVRAQAPTGGAAAAGASVAGSSAASLNAAAAAAAHRHSVSRAAVAEVHPATIDLTQQTQQDEEASTSGSSGSSALHLDAAALKACLRASLLAGRRGHSYITLAHLVYGLAATAAIDDNADDETALTALEAAVAELIDGPAAGPLAAAIIGSASGSFPCAERLSSPAQRALESCANGGGIVTAAALASALLEQDAAAARLRVAGLLARAGPGAARLVEAASRPVAAPTVAAQPTGFLQQTVRRCLERALVEARSEEARSDDGSRDARAAAVLFN